MYRDEEEISEKEKEAMIKENNLKIEKRYQRGKILVSVIAICNVVFVLWSNIVGSFNIVGVIIQIALSVALFRGVSWVRWFFVAGSALNVISIIYVLNILFTTGKELPTTLIVISALSAFQSIAGGIILAIDRGVSDFLHEQDAR